MTDLDIPCQPVSPPDEPKFMEPTRGQIEATIRWALRLILRGEAKDPNDPCFVAVRDAMRKLRLGDLLTQGLVEADLVRINDDVMLELVGEIRGILKTTPAEDWGV